MLASAFNGLLRLHSRPALLKRLTSGADLYSPIRITPSSFFRFHQGPETTTIKGKEFIIPVATMLGQFTQKISFDDAPTSGTFKITYGVLETAALNWDDTFGEIQTALRALAGLEQVLVTGTFSAGFTIVFQGFSTVPTILTLTDNSLDADETVTELKTLFSPLIKKGDRIVDGANLYAVDEIIDMHNLGGNIMGFRCRCD